MLLFSSLQEDRVYDPVLARSGCNYRLAEGGIQDRAFGDDASSLIIDVGWVLHDCANLSFLTLARGWVGDVDCVDRKSAQFYLPSAPAFPSNAGFADDRFRRVASHLEGAFASEDVFLSA